MGQNPKKLSERRRAKLLLSVAIADQAKEVPCNPSAGACKTGPVWPVQLRTAATIVFRISWELSLPCPKKYVAGSLVQDFPLRTIVGIPTPMSTLSP